MSIQSFKFNRKLEISVFLKFKNFLDDLQTNKILRIDLKKNWFELKNNETRLKLEENFYQIQA